MPLRHPIVSIYNHVSLPLWKGGFPASHTVIRDISSVTFELPIPIWPNIYSSFGFRLNVCVWSHNMEEIIAQRSRGLAKCLPFPLRQQSSRRLARFAPHCRIEGDSANNQPKDILSKSHRKPAMRSGCEASLRALCSL